MWALCCSWQTDTHVCPPCCCSPEQTESRKESEMLHCVTLNPFKIRIWTTDKQGSPCCRHQGSAWQNMTWCPRLRGQEAPSTNPDRGYCCSGGKRIKNDWSTNPNNITTRKVVEDNRIQYVVAADTHREAQFLELLSTERTPSLIAQTVLTFCLECCLPQAMKDVSLFLVSQRGRSL